MQTQDILNKALNQERISVDEATYLFHNADLMELGNTANLIRQRLHGKGKVTFVVDRNINYTNICSASCTFCAFATHPNKKRTDGYVLDYEIIKEKIQELTAQNGTQVLLQGGHNPELGIEYYEELFTKIKSDFPDITLHALSPSEITHIQETSSISLDEVITRLKKAGWDSLPGGGAEILIPRVRNILSPLKISGEQWLNVMEVASTHGIQASASMMFGHVETLRERVEHMQLIRDLQDKTQVFRAFISWTFQKGNTPLSKNSELLAGEGTKDPLDYLRTQAISRIFLDNISHIQASWVTQGFDVGQVSLHFGADDFGGTMLEENVVSAAGAKYSKSDKNNLLYQIRQAGFTPVQRNTMYKHLQEF